MNKQRVKRLQMPCSHEHLQTFDERPNMRKKPFCARFSPMATSIKEKRKSVYEKKKNTTTGIDHRNDVLRAPSGTRTLDTLIKSQVLYQLS